MVKMEAEDIISYMKNLRNGDFRIFNQTFWSSQTTDLAKQTDQTSQNINAKNSHLVSAGTTCDSEPP